jgi:phage terminase Nu1 subunit (DNA packaging protein)
VSSSEVKLRWSAHVVAARTKLLGLPSRAKQRLPHLTPADLATLDRLIREALEELGGEV